MPRKNKRTEMRIVSDRMMHENYVSDLAEGRKQRSNTFTPGRGKGSYKRKDKYETTED
jgi:stalled ribosome alternative rescue factor ArfA